MGSKRRIVKYILPFILEGRTIDQQYIEPFVGGANCIENVKGDCVGADANKYLIAALNFIKETPYKLPKNNKLFTEEMYNHIKNNKNKYPDYLVGYVGFFLSFGSLWFSG